MITKDPEEIEILKQGGKILADVLQLAALNAKPGISAFELDQLAEREIRKRGGVPAFKNYKPTASDTPYPGSLCISVDDEVVHGLPSKDKILKSGQIVGLDLGVVFKGLYTDSAITVIVGKVPNQASDLVETTKLCLENALLQVKPGKRIGDISHAIQSTAEAAGFSPVLDLVGHGVGRSVHEDPEIPCFGKPGTGPVLKEGMVIAIEPMINTGTGKIVIEPDGWTIKTADGGFSAHCEHTVIVTQEGCEIITRS